MQLPFKGNYPITQMFGENPEMYSKFGLRGHNGLDWGMPTGTPVLAPHSGLIKEAYFDPSGYGWYVKIENDKEGSVLGHFLSIGVKIGQSVNEGNQVALSNNTGNSTGSHLHWGYYYRFPRDRNNGYNGFINQYDLIKDLLVKPGSQNDVINQLRTEYEGKLADKDRECQQKMKDLRAEINKKLVDLAGQYT